MFGMIPFERHENNLFDAFDNFERNFFGSTSSAVTFRTDIRDEGDRFVLEAELPGFRKEDIQLHLKDGILTVSAQRTAVRQIHTPKENPNPKESGADPKWSAPLSSI